jgi:quercetin dioxygenase-like cupin family protein
MLVPRHGGDRVNLTGIDIVSKVTKQMSGGAYSLFEQIAPPGTAIPMHTHRTDEETMVVLEGHILCRLGDDAFGVGPGDVIHLPAGLPHGWRSDGDVPAVLLVMFSLMPDSDYEGMFRRLAATDLEDFETGERVTSANALEVVFPFVMP